MHYAPHANPLLSLSPDRVLPRGVGAWGDMVVVLRDGSKVEMRSLDK